MKILGVDPGCRIAGFGVAVKDGSRIAIVDYGYLKMPASKSLVERIGILHAFFTKKITEHEITDLALETPFLGRNAQNFLKLGYVRGILYLLADTHKLTLHEFSPREVKQTVTGFGGASKDQVARVIQQLCSHAVNAATHDVTDALAVTLCGAWQKKLQFSER